MIIDIPVDEHYGVGPYTDVYDHGPVTIFVPPNQDGFLFAACLDCGYVTEDIRTFLHEDCSREHNKINQTWRERLDKKGFPDENED
jgi:hypothetical protein